MRERKKPWFDRFLNRHPYFPLTISILALLAAFNKEIRWIISWIASQL
ncbi:MAG: hypothetical protein HFH73_13160 [Lachnospiraceae bacterium]|nr:hypothetical protein [Lachnospiraceae bacterium]